MESHSGERLHARHQQQASLWAIVAKGRRLAHAAIYRVTLEPRVRWQMAGCRA